MPKVTYELADGTVHDVDVPCGQSVMDGSVRNNLPGIVAECGGSCSCATCRSRSSRMAHSWSTETRFSAASPVPGLAP